MTRKKYVYNYERYDTWSKDPEKRWEAAMRALGEYLKEECRFYSLRQIPEDATERERAWKGSPL